MTYEIASTILFGNLFAFLLQGFYVYKVVENMPADRSGKINVGDKILKVCMCHYCIMISVYVIYVMITYYYLLCNYYHLFLLTCPNVSVTGITLFQVNGIEISGLTNDQLIKLLTSSESYVTFLFSREPSMTLL